MKTNTRVKYQKFISLTLAMAIITVFFSIPAHAALIIDNGMVSVSNSSTMADYDASFGDVVKCNKFGVAGIYNMYFTGNTKTTQTGQGPYRLFVSTDMDSDLLYRDLGNNTDGAVCDYAGTVYIAAETDNQSDVWAHIGHMDNRAWSASITNHTFAKGAISSEKLTKLDYVVRYSDGTKVVKDIYLDNKPYKSYIGAPTNNRTKFDEFVVSIQYKYDETPNPISIYAGNMTHSVVNAGYTPYGGTVAFTDIGGALENYAPRFVQGEDFYIPVSATVADILGMEGTYTTFEVRAEDGTVITAQSDADILSDSADGYYIYTVGKGSSDTNGLYSRIRAEFSEYYKDPGLISDADFFGAWQDSGWTTEPMLNYQDYPGLNSVKDAVVSRDYSTAKEKLLEYYKNKCDEFSLSTKGDGSAKQYLDYLMYKNNMLNTSGAGVSARAAASVDNEWKWIDIDITDILTASDFHNASKTYTLLFTALNKDNSVIEIKSRESGEAYAPRIEATVDNKKIEFQAVEDAYISAGNNTYVTFGTKDKNVLKVAESTTSIGKLDDPVDENTFRTYLKFNFDKIVRGNTVNKAVLKVYARNAGETGKKDMLLFSSGEIAWNESTISWGCGDITHNMYSFDGDPMPGWDMTKAAFANARMVTNPIRFEDTAFGVLGHYQTSQNEEVMYHLIRMLISYVTMKPDPAFNNNLSTAQRSYAFARLISYAVQSPMMTADVFTGFAKYFKLSGDYLESEKGFNSNNNWGVYQSTALLGLSWMYEEIATASKWEKTAFERLSFMAGNVNMSDGGSVESAVDYSTQSLGLFTSRLSSIARIVGKDKSALDFSDDFRDGLYKQAKFIMDTSGPGITAPQWGDDNSYTTNYKSDLVTTGNLLDAQDLLWNGTNGSKGTRPDYKSILYPVKGIATMRSDWSDDALWLHINNDKARTSHGHADDLSVIVFANGRYLLADPLIYLYNPTDNPIRQWLLGTNAHNTVMINNGTQTMPNKDADPGLITGWETNEAFDYVKMMTTTYPGFEHTRDVTFIKNKFWIINDLLEPDDKTKPNQYEQLWHFLPDADISVDPVTMETKTNFGDADIRIIPVEPMDYEPINNFHIEDYKASGNLEEYKQDETSSGIKVGYYSARYGAVSDAEYSSYRKANVTGDTTFNTILLPVTVACDYDVETMAIKTDLDATKASAMRIDYTNKSTTAKTTGIFYNLLDETLADERTVENYSTDGNTMYVEYDNGTLSSAILREGSHIKDIQADIELIKSVGNIDAVSVKWQSGNIYIESMNDLKTEDITIYNGGKAVNNVYLNSVPLSFDTEGSYVYLSEKTKNTLTKDETAKTFRATGVSEGNTVFIIAEYNSTDNKLINILNITDFSEGEAFDKTFALENYDNTKKYKAFLWQLSNMAPKVKFLEM